MKVLKYRLMTEVNHGTKEQPDIQQIFSDASLGWSEANEELAKREAYNGEYTIEDDGQPDPEEEVAVGPSQDDIGRLMVMMAQDANDDIALAVPTLYKVWESGKRYGYDGCEKIVKVPSGSVLKDDYLYRCIQPHTSQADWQPQVTPALWTRIDKSQGGDESDPIPTTRGMEYTYGLYYSDPEDNGLYKCTRTGETDGGTVTLQYLPHELVGHYFVFVRNLSE